MRALVYEARTGRIVGIRDVPAVDTADELLEHVYGKAKTGYACVEDYPGEPVDYLGCKVQDGQIVDDPAQSTRASAIISALQVEKNNLQAEKVVLEQQLAAKQPV